jgi:hypothetical protein
MGCLSLKSEIRNAAIGVAAATGVSLCVSAEPVPSSVDLAVDIKSGISVTADTGSRLAVQSRCMSGKFTCVAGIVCTVNDMEYYLWVDEGVVEVKEGFVIVQENL